jgi:hypothetical protein
MIWIDRVFALHLLLGAAGHTFGSLSLLPAAGSDIQVWSLGSALCAALLAVLNLLRAGRPADKPLAWVTALGSIGWLGVVIGFGLSIGRLTDFRVLWHGMSALMLAIFSLRSALSPAATT